MSQPASLKHPRNGEVVYACRHLHRDRELYLAETPRRTRFYVGTEEGLGILLRVETHSPSPLEGKGVWVRWVILCGWCRLKLRLKSLVARARPQHYGRRLALWEEKP